MPGRVCALHGLYRAAGGCPKCTASRSTSKPTTRANRIRSSARWQRVRARILDRDGHRCTYGLYDEDDLRGIPRGGCRARHGLDVHHRTPIEDGGDPYDDANLRSLCSRHHSVVERNYRQSKEATDGEAVEF